MKTAKHESKVVIVRLSLTLVRNDQMLFIREPGTHFLFDPGGRQIRGKEDEETLVEKIKKDLGIDLIRPLDLWTTYRAPAANKPLGTMVENRCYRPNAKQPSLDLSRATKEWVWFPAPLSPVALELYQRVQKEGLVPESR